jgi:DNA replication protein DnaC
MVENMWKREGKAIQPCLECDREFESELYMGKVFSLYRSNCREAKAMLLRLDQAEKHQRRLEHRRKEWLESPGGIPQKYRGMNWEDFRFDRGGERNRIKVQQLRQYAANFPIEDGTPDNPNPRKDTDSVLITRDVPGVGKTTLSCLILQDIINRYNNIARELPPFQFWTSGDIRLRLKSAQRFGSNQTEEEVYAHLTTIPLLVIDDVGKETITGADAANNYEMYFTLINKRYSYQLPVIITSNLMESYLENPLTPHFPFS